MDPPLRTLSLDSIILGIPPSPLNGVYLRVICLVVTEKKSDAIPYLHFKVKVVDVQDEEYPAESSLNPALFEVLQCWSMRKYVLKHKQMTNTFDTKIIFHNYILYWG